MARLVARRGAGYRDLAGSAPARRGERRGARSPGPGRCLRLARARPARRPLARASASIAPAASSTCRPCSPGPRDGRRPPSRTSPCRRMTLGQEVAEDYANLRLTLRRHPLALLRPWLDRRTIKAERLAAIDDGRRVEVAGLVLVRQRPGTASGVIFITIEDESGVANLVVWPAVFERFRRVVLGAQLMVVRGKVQKEGLVIHVVAETPDRPHRPAAPPGRDRPRYRGSGRPRRPGQAAWRLRRAPPAPRRPSVRGAARPCRPRQELGPARSARSRPALAPRAASRHARQARSDPSNPRSPAPTRSSATPATSASSIPSRRASNRATSTDAPAADAPTAGCADIKVLYGAVDTALVWSRRRSWYSTLSSWGAAARQQKCHSRWGEEESWQACAIG